MTTLRNASPVPLPAAIAVSGRAGSDWSRRAHAEPTHAYRTPFARDARGFCTHAPFAAGRQDQVFTRLPAEGLSDHFRSRLTHTLEVTQIARTVAEALGLNAQLAEALALAHDIGHPPFGHAGEQALDRALLTPGNVDIFGVKEDIRNKAPCRHLSRV